MLMVGDRFICVVYVVIAEIILIQNSLLIVVCLFYCLIADIDWGVSQIETLTWAMTFCNVQGISLRSLPVALRLRNHPEIIRDVVDSRYPVARVWITAECIDQLRAGWLWILSEFSLRKA